MKKDMSLIKNIILITIVSIGTLKISDLGFGFFQSNWALNSSLTKGTDRSIVLRELNPNQYASIRPNNNYMKDVENLLQINYEINVDEKGFIETGNLQESDPDIKILFLGGSTIETLFVPEKNRFPSIVERTLREKLNKSINVYNGGVSGNNSMHSIFAFLAKGIPLQPNYVVLMHNINDFALLSKTESYWVAPRSRALLIESVDTNFSTIEDSSRNIFFNIFKTTKNYLVPNLYTYLRPRLLANVQIHQDEFAGYTKNFSDLDTNLVKQYFKSSLTSFIKLSRAWNIEPILMTQANRINHELEYFQQWFLRHQRGEMTPKEFSDLYKSLNEITREVAFNEEVVLIDLDSLIPQSNKYIYDTVHLNESGSMLMAKIASGILLEEIQKQ
tara:strand:- start:810 stop:1973 length:1164 start_codon:yes stop_codon:yes gene_type:complete